MRQLARWQLDRIREDARRWQGTPAPCGIPYADPYSPCLPERGLHPAGGGREDALTCLTCGLRQRLALAAAR